MQLGQYSDMNRDKCFLGENELFLLWQKLMEIHMNSFSDSTVAVDFFNFGYIVVFIQAYLNW